MEGLRSPIQPITPQGSRSSCAPWALRFALKLKHRGRFPCSTLEQKSFALTHGEKETRGHSQAAKYGITAWCEARKESRRRTCSLFFNLQALNWLEACWLRAGAVSCCAPAAIAAGRLRSGPHHLKAPCPRRAGPRGSMAPSSGRRGRCVGTRRDLCCRRGRGWGAHGGGDPQFLGQSVEAPLRRGGGVARIHPGARARAPGRRAVKQQRPRVPELGRAACSSCPGTEPSPPQPPPRHCVGWTARRLPARSVLVARWGDPRRPAALPAPRPRSLCAAQPAPRSRLWVLSHPGCCLRGAWDLPGVVRADGESRGEQPGPISGFACPSLCAAPPRSQPCSQGAGQQGGGRLQHPRDPPGSCRSC